MDSWSKLPHPLHPQHALPYTWWHVLFLHYSPQYRSHEPTTHNPHQTTCVRVALRTCQLCISQLPVLSPPMAADPTDPITTSTCRPVTPGRFIQTDAHGMNRLVGIHSTSSTMRCKRMRRGTRSQLSSPRTKDEERDGPSRLFQDPRSKQWRDCAAASCN